MTPESIKTFINVGAIVFIALLHFGILYYFRYRKYRAVLKTFMTKARELDNEKEEAEKSLNDAIALLKRWEDHKDNPKRNFGLAVTDDTKVFLQKFGKKGITDVLKVIFIITLLPILHL